MQSILKSDKTFKDQKANGSNDENHDDKKKTEENVSKEKTDEKPNEKTVETSKEDKGKNTSASAVRYSNNMFDAVKVKCRLCAMDMVMFRMKIHTKIHNLSVDEYGQKFGD